MVTESPPASDPWPGETLVTLGAATAAGVEAGVVAGSVIGVGDDGGGGAHSGGRESPPTPCVGQAVEVPLPPSGRITADALPRAVGVPPEAAEVLLPRAAEVLLPRAAEVLPPWAIEVLPPWAAGVIGGAF